MSYECEKEECCDTTCESVAECGEECCDMPERLLALADEAWFEVLKERIKKEIEASCGDKLDHLAKIVAAANNDRWAHKISGKVRCNDYKRSVQEFMASCACDKSE